MDHRSGRPEGATNPELAPYLADVAECGNGANPGDALLLQRYAAAAALANAIKTAGESTVDGYNSAWNATKDLQVPGLLADTSLTAGTDGRGPRCPAWLGKSGPADKIRQDHGMYAT